MFSLLIALAINLQASSILKIGALKEDISGAKEKSGMKTFEEFVTEETSLPSEISEARDWRELVESIEKGDRHMGVFLGHEFAWASKTQPKLKVALIGVTRQKFPVVCLISHQSTSIEKLEELRGQTLAVPTYKQRMLKVVLNQMLSKEGLKLDGFFKSTQAHEYAEDAIESVVERSAGLAVVEKDNLAAFERRKPGRFKQLKEISCSAPLPPAVIAYHSEKLDAATLQQFQKGILKGQTSAKGRHVLQLLKMDAFELEPKEFSESVKNTLALFPVPEK